MKESRDKHGGTSIGSSERDKLPEEGDSDF